MIYLVRHGEAEGNIFRRLHGQYDSLLTPRGERQVRCLRARFAQVHVDACYASDLTRASLTARSVYLPKGLPLRRDAHFREVDVGSWEDIPYGYLDSFEERGMWEFNHDPVHWHVPGSERFAEYTQRFLDGMTRAAQDFDGGTIAIFSHGAVLRGTLMRLFFMDDLGKMNYSDNAGVCRLHYDRGSYTYDYLNDNSHIPEELSTFYIQRWWRTTERRKESALYFLPLSEAQPPDGLPVPDLAAEQTVLIGMLCGKPVGWIAMGGAENGAGQMLGIRLLPEMFGRYYADQLLGCAFSHFRRLGCTELWAADGAYPDALLERYEFDPVTRRRNISTKIYDWGSAPVETAAQMPG